MKKLILIFAPLFLTLACKTTMENPEKWTDSQLNSWFEKKAWLQGWAVQPDETINKLQLAKAIYNHPERWEKTFRLLSQANLDTLENGKYELMGDTVYYTISSYMTKDPENALFESHKKYIDIQYVFDGEEQIGIEPVGKLESTAPYNPDKDILFYAFDRGIYPKAAPASFFVFFPDDAHRPGLKINENSQVKKLVVKVRVD